MKLSDFQQPAERALTLQDFGQIVNRGPALGDATASLVAGTHSLLQGGDTEVYYKTKQDILDPDRRESFLEVQERLKKQLFEDSKEAMSSLLADPNIPDEIKKGVVTSTIAMTKLPPISTMNILAEQAIIADGGDETPLAEEARDIIIEDIAEMNKKRRQITSMINGANIKENPTTVDKITDIAEFFAPFAELIHYRDLQKELGLKDEASGVERIFTGEAKEKVYSYMRNVPIADRAKVVADLIDVIENNSQIILPDGNDIVVIQDLQRMALGSDYSDTERWMDNIFGALDILGGLGSVTKAFGKAAKVGKATKKASDFRTSLEVEADTFVQNQREAERIKESQMTPLEKEAAEFKSEVPTDKALEAEARDFVPSEPATDAKLAKEAEEFKAAPEPTVDSLFREAVKEKVRSEVVPAAPSQVVKDVNPELARNLHKVMVGDETDEAAKALYGTNKAEALSKDILPEPGLKPGQIPNKVDMTPNPRYAEPADLKRARKASGNLIATDAELVGIQSRIVQGLKNVAGMHLQKQSLVIRANKDGSTNFQALYSPIDSGWRTKEDAINAAKFAFREYRGMDESAFKILQRVGDKWVEITPGKKLTSNMKNKELSSNGQFAVALDWNWSFHPNDWDEVELLTSSKGLVGAAVRALDSSQKQIMASLGQGSLVQNILDPASVINSRILGAASVAIDKAFHLRKLYVKIFAPFVDQYAKLPKDRRALVADYIREANLKELPLDITDLYARGFSREEIALLEDWRKANDAVWYPMNDDLRHSLVSQGVKVFTDSSSNTKLYGRPVGRTSAVGRKRVYNTNTGKFEKLDKNALDLLYENGGSLFALTDPVKIEGRWVENVISRNSPSGGYIREFYEGEKVLAYHNGYYPVSYTSNYYIYKMVRDGDGNDFPKVIASAETREQAQTLTEMYQNSEKDVKFNFRPDRNLSDSSGRLFDEGAWSSIASGGLSAQRIRGERLADGAAASDARNASHAHLMDPLEAVTQQVRSLSQRTAARPVIEAMKVRWLKNYAPYLDLKPSPKTGRIEFPDRAWNLRTKDGAPSRMAADARTNFNYIYGLENGYINMIDEGYKGAMNAFAIWLGERGFKGERLAFKAARRNPTRDLKHATFKILISSNPIRQAILQRMQLVMVTAFNPKYAATNFGFDFAEVEKVRFGGKGSERGQMLFKEIEEAGLLESVSAHNWLREESLRLADLTVMQKAGSIGAAPINWLQKVGFDAAERDILTGFWLAARDKAVQAGKDVSLKRVQDEILAETRANTLNMNRAGNMAYSENTFSLAMQFFSFRHKALLQPFSNKNLTMTQRATLLGYTTALFGVDATFLSAVFAMLPDSLAPEWRDKFVDGMVHHFLNYTLSTIAREDVAMDWSDFAPSDMYGVSNLILGLINDPLGRMIWQSPSGGIFFGADSRVGKVFQEAMRYFNVAEDYEDPELATTLTDVIVAASGLFSGFSQSFKALYAYKTGMALSASGRITDSDVTRAEAALMLTLGLKTETTAALSDIYRKVYGSERPKVEKDAVKRWYLLLKQHLARRNMSIAEKDFAARVLGEAWRVFGEERPKAVANLVKLIEEDIVRGDYTMFNNILRQSGWVDPEELKEMARELPPGEARDNVYKLLGME